MRVVEEKYIIPIELPQMDSPVMWLANEFELATQDLRRYSFNYEDSGMNFKYLSEILCENLLGPSDFYFIKLDTTVWKSGEDENLVDRFCQAIGVGEKMVIRVPIQGTSKDINDLSSFVHMSMLFGWDSAAVGPTSIVAIEHDGLATILAEEHRIRFLALEGVEFTEIR